MHICLCLAEAERDNDEHVVQKLNKALQHRINKINEQKEVELAEKKKREKEQETKKNKKPKFKDTVDDINKHFAGGDGTGAEPQESRKASDCQSASNKDGAEVGTPNSAEKARRKTESSNVANLGRAAGNLVSAVGQTMVSKLTKSFNTRKLEMLCLISKFLSVNLLLDIAWHYRINLTRFDYGVNLSN